MGGETRLPYPEEYRARIIELLREGRNPENPVPDLELSGQTIRNWVR